MIWLVFGAMFLLAAAIVARPLYRDRGVAVSGAGGGDEALEVYRQQLAELEHDLAQGSLNEEEAATARLEIHRRMLEPAGRTRNGDRAMPRMVVAGVAILILAGASVSYLQRGQPDLVSFPVDRSTSSTPQFQLPPEMGKIEDRLASLEVKLAAEPDNLEGWTMLARSYGVLGRTTDAANAYARAVALDPDNAELRLTQAELLVDALGGLVSPAAILAFQGVQEIDAGHPAPRFYMGLAEYQNNKTRKALEIWQSLAGDSPADAPWLPSLRAQIARAESDLGFGE